MEPPRGPRSERILFPFDLARVRLDRGLVGHVGLGGWRMMAVTLCVLTDGVYRLGSSDAVEPVSSPLVIRSAVSDLAGILHRGSTPAAIFFFGRELVDQIVAACGSDRRLARFTVVTLSDSPSKPPVVYPLGQEGGTVARGIVSRIDLELGRRLPGHQSVILAQLLELLVLLHRERSRQPAPSGPMVRERIAAICAHVERHYDQEFRLEELAGRCALSASHFSHVFRSCTGVPVFEYVNRVRIGRACLLLRNSNQSVLEIAYQVGYNNISFFNRYFRRVMGMSPTEYRNLVQNT